MAARAPIKKRALAEFQSLTQTVEPEQDRSVKKLRLIKKPADSHGNLEGSSFIGVAEAEIDALDGSRSPTENFRAMSRIVASLPLTTNLIMKLHQKIITLFGKEEDSALKAKYLTTLQLLNLPHSDLLTTIDEILRLIQNEDSALVINSGLTVLLKMAKGVNDSVSNSRILIVAKKLITKTDAKVKCKCLEIIGLLTPFQEGPGVQQAIQLLHAYGHSHEPRVRTIAFKMLLHLHEKGAKLEVLMYNEVAKNLDDDYESVKLASLQLLWAMSQSYPEHQLPSPVGGGEKIRLVDDAFAKICQSINDPCVQVRVLAAELLGKIPQVSQTFLEQTLDKKLMSDMRRKRSAHERQWEKVKKGEWASGKKWADDAPQELIDADSVSLITSGAAGAFVHGLEDEFLEVRSAAVDSLCVLAIKSPDFANLALDFLVDMFNDEIEDVRLKAIDSLTKISKHIVLWEDQLETILAALEDSSIDIRESLHQLLSGCHLMTKDCVKMCLDNILDNLKRYPQDKKSIWKCLEGVGKNHPWVVLPLVPQLLSMHPFFDTSEPDPEDPAYVSVLILVFNAAKGCPTMGTLFDEKLLRHYHYLRDTLSHLVPELSIFSSETGGVSSQSAVDKANSSGGNGRVMLKDLTAKLKSSGDLNIEMRTKLCKLILKDLKRLSEVDQDISAIAKFTMLYIKSQLVYSSSLNSSSWVQLSQNTQSEPLRVQIQQFMQHCLKMQYGFTGFSPNEYGLTMQLKLRALALQLVYIVRGSNASALAICQNFLEQAESVQKYMEENDLSADEFTFAMFKMLDGLDEPKPGTVAKHLLPLFEKHPIPLISFSSSIKMVTATIIEPTGESDTALKFTAGLLLGIPLDAEIHNLEDTSHVRIMITYPDQQVHLICPRASDFRPDSTVSNCVRLLTTVTISHQAWTEPCPVTVSIVLDLRAPETNFNRKLMWKKDSTYIIQLSDEKQVLVAPKPSKRGI